MRRVRSRVGGGAALNLARSVGVSPGARAVARDDRKQSGGALRRHCVAAESVVALALPLAWNNRVLPALDLPLRGRTVAHTVFAVGYVAVFGGRPKWLSASGFRWGIGSSAVVLAGYAVALSIPAVRRVPLEVAERVPETSTLEWIALHIPVGTVLAEEAVFRGTLDRLLDDAFGPSAPVLAALDFGLWHVHPARVAGDSVAATVLATTAAGLVFGVLRRRTGSATAPALLHLAINIGGALMPVAARWIEELMGRSARSAT
ncbi:CPBP family intramembrane glutamic endopeptidase [Nocardia sp. NPDC059177]|uniref:CPBP family intramembrane glutamic endopeptidase n=1 Tax=Nocardia sp. NPDC059177 TaxID=3346759 RepID=UPI0036C1569B